MHTDKPPDETNKPAEVTPAATPPGATPPATPPAAPATPAITQQAAPVIRELGDDEDPKDGERVTMTGKQFRARMSRASSAKLKEVHGTDDVEIIKGNEKKRLDLEAAAEQRRLADLSEIERQKELTRIANERATAAEERTLEVEDRQMVAQADAEVKVVAGEYIDPKFWRHVRQDLSSHLAAKFTVDQLDAMDEAAQEKEARSFFTDYVKENPEYAKKGGQTTNEPPPRVPLVTGGANPADGANVKPAPLITTGKYKGKTAAPGHPNSMTDAEFKGWKKEQGLTS